MEDISFQINTGERIGLVGNNGAGKTTLLKIILGTHPPDSGSVEKITGLSMGYLPQQMKITDSKILINEVKTAFSQITKLKTQASRLEREIDERDDYESGDYLNSINRLSDINTRIELLGAAKINEQVEKTLTGLGFRPEDFIRPTKEFSGGWRMRIELAKILLQRPDPSSCRRSTLYQSCLCPYRQ